MSAVRRLLGWFCPTGMGELGTKQLVPQLPGLVVIWVANKPPQILIEAAENSLAGIR